MDDRSESPQQVGINAHLLSHQANYRSAGVHGYIHNLIRTLPLVQGGPQWRYTVFLGGGVVEPSESLTVIRSSWPTARPIVRILWEQLALPRQKMDLLHGTAFVTPLFAPWPTVVTVYDLSFVHYPSAFTPGRRAYLRLFSHLSCRRARRVIAISESTRRDLVKQWRIPSAKIEIAYPGVGDQFRPVATDEIATFRHRHSLPERFILHLGTLQPRKNLVRLVRAYSRLETNAKLVLAGGRGWLYGEILAEIERLNLQNDIVLPGYVPAEELPLWYNAAAAFAFPSLYEGFGLPVVEAMACGTPVITSTVSSLPEAAGDAGLMVDPCDTDALAESLHRALTDENLREELRVKGLAQASLFRWGQTAVATFNAYRHALGCDP